MDSIRDALFNDFELSVRAAFSFLADKYGFVLKSTNRTGLGGDRDAECHVVYVNSSLDIGVDVCFDYDSCMIFVTIFVLHEKTVTLFSPWGQTQYQPAVDLSSIVKFITGYETAGEPLAFNRPCNSYSRNVRMARIRKDALQGDMAGILREYAAILEEYGVSFFTVNLDKWRKVQAYHRERFGFMLSPDGRWLLQQ